MASEAAVSMATTREIIIVSGVHQGASFTLTEELLLIGGDAGCDMWLSDAGLAARHAALMADGRGVAVRSLEGQVSVDGQPLQGSERVALSPGSEISLGNTGVRLRVAGQAPSAAQVAPGDSPRPAQQKRRKSRVLVASMMVVGSILAAGVAIHELRPAQASTPSMSGASADAKLSDAELIEQVRDVFRANGYDAMATHLGGRRVRIENLDGHHERVQRAVAQVRADIPQLESLTFAAPESAEPPSDPPFYEGEAAGRLSITVAGNMGYLVASDGGRYFTGSVLPSGYTVRRITSRAIQVERDGQLSWFRF
jgi:hypothetical protein